MYALRNGAVADAMRRMGAPYRIIFGVNLPQLAAIAAETGKSAELAEQLWENSSTRESMLLAPMIYPEADYDIATARKWISEIPTAEVADILCMKLLKKRPYADSLADELMPSSSPMARYTALRLLFNRLPARATEAKSYAETEFRRGNPLTRGIARALMEEVDFINGTTVT